MSEQTKTSKELVKRQRQGLTFCRPGKAGKELAGRSNTCPECGFRVRGDKHAYGPHHQLGKNGRLNVK
jgi:hypothetical protein